MIFIPEHNLQKIDKMLLDFIWNSKPAKVKHTTIIAPISDGWLLGMVDLYNVHLASKISWIKWLHDPTNAKWKTVMLKMMNVNLDILNTKCDFLTTNKFLTFYSQVLKVWQQIYCFTPHEIVNKFILYHNNIKIGNTILDQNYINSPNIKILDILYINYQFLSLRQLNITLRLDLEQIKYNSFIYAIPPNWNKTLKKLQKKISRTSQD